MSPPTGRPAEDGDDAPGDARRVRGEPNPAEVARPPSMTAGKRLFDVVLAVVGLVVAAPLMALIALAIKVDSPGPVIFSQPRVGLGGRAFRIHKFRKFPEHWGDQGASVTVSGDVRMTRLGRLLERIKFDELPQLWNILKGEMSFVGPRPETLALADLYQGEFAAVLDHVPGIFGPNQVAYRNEADMYPADADPEAHYRRVLFPAKARTDMAYFDRAGRASDAYWIIAGIWVSLISAMRWRRLLTQRGPHLIFDAMFLLAGWTLGHLLQFDGLPSGQYWVVYAHGLWLLPLVVLSLMFAFDVYNRPVRYFSLESSVRLTVTVGVGMAMSAMVVMATIERSPSLTVFAVAGAVTVIIMVAARVAFRGWWRARHDGAQSRDHFGAAPPVSIAIYGAGRRGAALAELLREGFKRADVVGFVDDNDVGTRGQTIAGRPVLGAERDLDTIHARHPIDELWLTFVADPAKLLRLRRWCERHGIRLLALMQTEPFQHLCPSTCLTQGSPERPAPTRSSP